MLPLYGFPLPSTTVMWKVTVSPTRISWAGGVTAATLGLSESAEAEEMGNEKEIMAIANASDEVRLGDPDLQARPYQ